MAKSFLDTLSRPTAKPVIVVIAAEAGVGKTSLAALLPKPIIIPIEDGTASLEDESDIAIFPKPKSIDDIFGYITSLVKEDHPFENLILDSVTKYDQMCVAEVQERNETANLSKCDGGFGGGYHTIGRDHEALLNACKQLQERKGMNIIFIAHTDTQEVNPPDSDSYTKYTIRATKSKQIDCAASYVDNSDLVAFIKLKTFTKEGKAKSDGSRIISCQHHPAHVSKNRFGIEKDIPFEKGVNPFNGLIKQLEDK